MNNEVWKPIKGYENKYEVSNLGRIKSLKRIIKADFHFGNTRTYKERILKVGNVRGYQQVNLLDGNSKHKYVHRLVAETFIPNPKGLSEVNHKDENKSNNCVSNLEWMSKIDNLHYGTRQERSVSKRSIPVFQYDLQGNLINTYKSAREASRQTGITQGSISHCVKGERKIAGGYMWKAAA